jgi:hypothetical protein
MMQYPNGEPAPMWWNHFEGRRIALQNRARGLRQDARELIAQAEECERLVTALEGDMDLLARREKQEAARQPGGNLQWQETSTHEVGETNR